MDKAVDWLNISILNFLTCVIVKCSARDRATILEVREKVYTDSADQKPHSRQSYLYAEL